MAQHNVTSVPGSRQARIGMWTVVTLVMGNMIGSGVFLLPSSLAPFGGGVAVIGWLVSAAGATALALVFGRLARLRPAAGGPYAYTRATFGDLPAFLVTWSYWISIWAALAALAVAAVGYLDPFIPAIVRHPPSAAALAIAMVWTFVLVNSRGVLFAGRVQVVTTVLKVLPLVAIAVAGLVLFEPSRFTMASGGGAGAGGGVVAVVTLTLWAFLGLESGTVPADAVVSPERTIPRATVIGTALTTAIYVFGTVGVMSLVPLDELATSTAPFADAARHLAGNWAGSAVALGGAVSCLGALNGWTLLVGRLPKATADDGLFPAVFARRSRRQQPVAGMLIAGVLASVLVILNSSRGLVELFTFIIRLSTLGTLVPYLFCSLASLMVPEPDRRRLPRAAFAIGVLAFLYAMTAVGGAGADVVYLGFLMLMAGLPVYVWVVRDRPAGRGA